MLLLLLDKTFQSDPPGKTQKDVAADSNTTDLLEVCSQGSPERLPQGEPVQTSSPSLLCPCSNPSLVEISTSEAAPAAEATWDTLCADQGLQGSRGSQATLPTLSPVLPVLPSSSLQSPPDRMPRREQACSSGTASSPHALKPGLAHARTKGGEAVGAKRKLMEEDEQAPSGQQQHPPSTSKGRGRGTGRRSELTSPQGAKKSRKETGLRRRRKELEEEEEEEEVEEEEEEQASPARAGPSSRPEQHRTPEPVNRKQLVRSPEGWGCLGRLSVPTPLVSIPRIFPHQAGGDGKLNAGVSVDSGGSGNTEGIMRESCNHLGWKRPHEMEVQPFPSTAKPTTEPQPQLPHPHTIKSVQGW